MKVTVTRTVEYEIEVDETLWGKECAEKWQNTFWDLPVDYDATNEDPDEEAAIAFARGLAEQSARLGSNQFIEGFGMCATSKDYADAWNNSSGGKQNPATNGLYLRELDDDIQSDFEIVREEED